MVFQGEEISIGLRGFTYGYDYYTPERSVCFHMYAVRDHKEERQKVPRFWENAPLYQGVGGSAMKRLGSIIGMDDFPRSEWTSVLDEKKYGLGEIRKPQTFFDTFGIHIERHKVEKHLCGFVGATMTNVFTPALRKNRMGMDYDKIDFKFVNPSAKLIPPHAKMNPALTKV
jgi:hypothetical protein